ncbi:MAG: Tll0287-like domain-containing protein [Nitrospiraceae bacterium]
MNKVVIALRWGIPVLLVAGWFAVSEAASVRERPQEPGPPLQTVLEVENSARLLAILLDSGRSVINENQDLFDDPEKEDKGFSPEVFEHKLVEMFRSRSGIDLQNLTTARLPKQTKELLRAMVSVSKRVVADAQSEINRKGISFKGFIPAIFGTRVASRFTDSTGVRLKQTALAPRNPTNEPDSFERAALQEFADPSYPREKVISEVTAKGRSLRLLFPLYTTRQCLTCHGEPKGEPDRTGYPREGLRLGQNAGAISVVIPIRK